MAYLAIEPRSWVHVFRHRGPELIIGYYRVEWVQEDGAWLRPRWKGQDGPDVSMFFVAYRAIDQMVLLTPEAEALLAPPEPPT